MSEQQVTFKHEQLVAIRSMKRPVVRFENDVMKIVDDEVPGWFKIVVAIAVLVLLPLSCGVGAGIAKIGYEAVTR